MPRSERMAGIEILRLFAACAVVVIHFWPRSEGSGTLDAIVVGTCRFAVPFFFATSAYFLKGKLNSLSDGLAFARRWIPILVLWHAVHAAWFTAIHFAKMPDPYQHLPMWLMRLFSVDTLFEGVAWPLWYLHSLVLCVLLASAIPLRYRTRFLLPFGLLLYGLALTWDPWRGMMPQWWPHPPFYIKAREFLFSATLPFAAGLATTRLPKHLSIATLLVCGLVLQTVEIMLSPTNPWGEPHDFFLGSVLVGVGLFWAGLSWQVRSDFLARWGAASLPMYILQLILFSMIRGALSLPLTKLGLDTRPASIIALLVGLIPYGYLCLRISENQFWKRHLR
jgi:peptidoglycan/LPS O-acetylase OafA/YrhL